VSLVPSSAAILEEYASQCYDYFMRYELEIKLRAWKDLRRIRKVDAARVVETLENLQDDLKGER
jgi:hypothetical protein